ncbi:MAG: glycosyltransferase family 4 protein, partial [Actinobacteria bacterium]|nr:glycosyltransferase family 4 protein [Actinomycetota bacterium]
GLWPDQYRSGPKRPIAIVAGRLWDEAKGAVTAVMAAAGLPLELRLLGPVPGPNGEESFLPESPNARYLGAVPWKDVRAELAAARFYLATSSYEPFGLAALEAALSGCVIVAADLPFYREVWAEAAVYYPRGDASYLRAKLAALVRMPKKAEEMAEAARDRALALYSADRMVAEYRALYADLHHDS